MDYITAWISEIILLILMAIVLELLLPNSSLQRYVRMVVGLLLLLALLKPVLSIFDTDLDELVGHLTASPVLTDEQMKNSMKSTKSEIQAFNRAYIEKQMAVQYKKTVKKEVADRFHMDVTGVHVNLDDFKPDGSPASIQKITVYLAEHEQKENGNVEPIEPVTIDVSETAEESPETDGKKKKIHEFLAKQWRLPAEKITVVLEGGDDSKQ